MSENQDKRKELLAVLAQHLKPHGFKKKAFTYKRETEKGLWQIVELQLGGVGPARKAKSVLSLESLPKNGISF